MSTETEDLTAYAEKSDLRNDPLVVDLLRSLNQNRKEVGRLLGILKREQVAHSAALSSSMQEVERLRARVTEMKNQLTMPLATDVHDAAWWRRNTAFWASEAARHEAAAMSGGSAVVLAEVGRLQQEARTAREAQTIAEQQRDVAVVELADLTGRFKDSPHLTAKYWRLKHVAEAERDAALERLRTETRDLREQFDHKAESLVWSDISVDGLTYDLAELSESTREVVEAWTFPGPAPELHRKAQTRLQNTWPTLANALIGLVAARPALPEGGGNADS